MQLLPRAETQSSFKTVKIINEASQEDQLPGTHFDLSLGHSPGSWSKNRRDHARGLLSQQWNMGFP